MAPLEAVRLLPFSLIPGMGLETEVVSLSISPDPLPKHRTMQKGCVKAARTKTTSGVNLSLSAAP